MFLVTFVNLSIIGFQTPATTVMEAIVSMHHYVFFYLILVFIFVIYIYIHILFVYFFLPTFLYDLSYKFNDDSFMFLKFLRLSVQLFLNFEFFSSYIIYFSQRQAIKFALKEEFQIIMNQQFYPTEFPYKQFPLISNAVESSTIDAMYLVNILMNIIIFHQNYMFYRIQIFMKLMKIIIQFFSFIKIYLYILQLVAQSRQELILTSTRLINHHSNLEIIQTLIPSFFLFLIALPSFALLYEFDEILAAAMTFKVIGYQQFQTYEVLDLYLNNVKISNLKDILIQLETKNIAELSDISKEAIANSFIEKYGDKQNNFNNSQDKLNNNKDKLNTFNNFYNELNNNNRIFLIVFIMN